MAVLFDSDGPWRSTWNALTPPESGTRVEFKPQDSTLRRNGIELTPTICQRTKAAARKQVLWDAKVLGLALVITPKVESGGGRRTWFFVARRGGNQIWVRIGEYMAARPGQNEVEVWTVDAARGEAGKLRKIHDNGGDIRAITLEKRKPKTLAELWAHYMESRKFRELKPKTQINERHLMKNHVLPGLGSRLVSDLTHNDAEVMFRGIESAGDPPHSATANQSLTQLGKMLRYAQVIGWRKPGESATRNVTRVNIPERTRVLTVDELERINVAMGEMVAAGTLHRDMVDAVYLLALSGMRPGEPVLVEWPCISWDEHCLTLNDHKTVKVMGPKLLPINGPMERVLRSRQPANSTIWTVNPWVFPSRKLLSGHVSPNTLGRSIRAIMERAGVAGATPHDFRRTFSTMGIELGVDSSVMDKLLGHKLPGVQGHYVHLTVTGVMMEGSEITAAWVWAALNGKKPRIGVRVGAEGAERKA